MHTLLVDDLDVRGAKGLHREAGAVTVRRDGTEEANGGERGDSYVTLSLGHERAAAFVNDAEDLRHSKSNAITRQIPLWVHPFCPDHSSVGSHQSHRCVERPHEKTSRSTCLRSQSLDAEVSGVVGLSAIPTAGGCNILHRCALPDELSGFYFKKM